jgi:hypothetical protein
MTHTEPWDRQDWVKWIKDEIGDTHEDYPHLMILAGIADALENIANELYTWRRWDKGDAMVEK